MNDSLHKGNKKDRKNESLHDQKNKCPVQNHAVTTSNDPINILIFANIGPQTIFEDFTTNHNKTLLKLSSIPTPAEGVILPAQPLDITIYTRNSNLPIIARIPGATDTNTIQGSTRIFQVENFQSLTVSTPDIVGTLHACIEKTFCIYCQDVQKKEICEG
ncbi:exosporium protein D [Bacillus sp. C1]